MVFIDNEKVTLDLVAAKRNVILPKGKWLADDGKVYAGGKTYEINVSIDRLPYFEKIK